MKWLLRIVLGLIGLIALLIGGTFAYAELTYDKDFASHPLPPIKASSDPAVIAHGEYVANAVAHCPACHWPGEYDKPRKLGPRHDLRGGMKIPAPGFGIFYPPNITPHTTGIKDFSDGELARAIRHGVNRHGRIAPVMHLAVGPMSDEDLTAVISYLRSIAPIANQAPPDEYGLIGKIVLGIIGPKTNEPAPYVAPASGAAGISVERGKYLATGPAFCAGCHTPVDPFDGFAPSGPLFSGEAQAEPDATDHNYEIVAPNITPDPKTGYMRAWTEDAFVARFRAGRAVAGSKMPWEAFQQMTDEDLRSIYRFLQTVPKAERDVGPTRRPVGWQPAAK
jgi:mono/diheme cytochrome c family protein